jgi:SAM-dependent methyltransferase
MFVIRGGSFATLSRGYRTASVGVVSDPRAMPGAALAARLFRVPWVAWLSEGSEGKTRGYASTTMSRVLKQAAAVVTPRDHEHEVLRLAPQARVIHLEAPERIAEVLTDVAVPSGARRHSGATLGRTLVAAWLFFDGRAERLAIRLVPLTGKARLPIHPKHLVRGATWHFWYRDRLLPDDRVLDVGCSNGVHSLAAAALVASVVGVDVDARELERAQLDATERNVPNVHFFHADLTETSTLTEFGAGAFDAVLLLDVLEHLVDRVDLLKRIRSVLRPGGRLFVSVPNADTSYKRWRKRLGGDPFSDPDHKLEYDESRIRAEVEAAGFSIDTIMRGGFDTPFGGVSALLGSISMRAYGRLAARRNRLSALRPGETTAFRVVAIA